MSQQELAIKLNISVDTIRRWEQGKRKPNYEDVDNLAATLSISRETLIGDPVSEGLVCPADPSSTRQNHGILIEREANDQKVRIILPPTTETYSVIRELLGEREFILDTRFQDFFNIWVALSDEGKEDLLAQLHVNGAKPD